MKWKIITVLMFIIMTGWLSAEVFRMGGIGVLEAFGRVEKYVQENSITLNILLFDNSKTTDQQLAAGSSSMKSWNYFIIYVKYT